ncbi:Holliday junction branch migration protein RuvA [Candidatus Auribacterota bacterium]
MISYLNGILRESSPARIVVEVSGVGYDLFIPLSTYENLPDINSQIKILTYQHVREDALDLYGFISHQERDLFKILIGVSGIGSKVAIGILSGIETGDFFEAVATGDTSRISSVPGIGKKTAERLIVELKDKLSSISHAKISVGSLRTGGGKVLDDVTEALKALGYKPAAAENAARKAVSDDAKLSTEDLIRKALKYV